MTPFTRDDIQFHIAGWQREIAHARGRGPRWEANIPIYEAKIRQLEQDLKEMQPVVLELPARRLVQLELEL